jgi:hypothetical protein
MVDPLRREDRRGDRQNQNAREIHAQPFYAESTLNTPPREE